MFNVLYYIMSGSRIRGFDMVLGSNRRCSLICHVCLYEIFLFLRILVMLVDFLIMRRRL
jgi:hypothetical protein